MAAVRTRSSCRLSPNEEAYLRHMQMEERRKARLVQVREQEKSLARQLRERVKNKRESERRVLKEHVDAALAETHEAELRKLESKYLSRVGSVGQGHRDAQQINEEENRLQKLRILLEAKQRWRAQDRHAAAVKELSASQLKERQKKEQSLQSRKQALEVEKERAKRVASANPSLSQMIIMDFELGQGRRVQFKEADGYSSSYYHIPNPVVQRMGTPDLTEPNAKEKAILQAEEDRSIKKSAVAMQQEQSEMARLRFKHALAKVKLEKENAFMLNQLETLEREDRAHRQKSLSKMPPNLFQPAHRRIEMATEQQREMEGAFERLFVRTQGNVPPHTLTEPSSQVASLDSSSSTEHTPVDLVDYPRQPYKLSEHKSNGGTTTKSPKSTVTPDSGIRADVTTSIEDSGNTDTSSSTQHASPKASRSDHKTAGSHRPLHGNTRTTAAGSRSPLPRGSRYTSYISSSTSPEESREHVRSRPSVTSQQLHLPHPRSAWAGPTLQSQDTISSTECEGTLTKAMFTQTEKPNPEKYFVSTTPLPEQPELTATDITSSDDQSSTLGNADVRRTGGRSGRDSSFTARPVRRGEGMKTLLSMIQSQHQAWNDRMKNREKLVQPVASVNDSLISPLPTVTQVQSGNNDTAAVTVEQQPDSLSIYTLSTRESTLSPDASVGENHLQSSSHQQLYSNLPDMSYSPDHLSISPYHTTLETSAVPTTLQNYHMTFEPKHTPTRVVSSMDSNVNTTSGSPTLDNSLVKGGSGAQVQVNQSNMAQHTQRTLLPAYMTVQSANTPVVSSVSPLVTSFRASSGPTVVHSVPSQAATTDVHMAQSLGPGNNVLTSLPSYPLAPYPTVGEGLSQTGYRPISSLVQPLFTSQPSAVATSNMQEHPGEKHLTSSPERGLHYPRGVIDCSTTATTTVDITTAQAGRNGDTASPSPSKLRYKYSPSSGATSPQLNSAIVSGIANTSGRSEEMSQNIPLRLQPVAAYVTKDSSLHDVHDETSQSEMTNTTNQDPEHSQLSILTLETTQNSFSKPQHPFPSEREHSSIQHSTLHAQHHSSVDENRSGIETYTQVEELRVSRKTGSNLSGGAGTNMHLLDTIEESDAECIEHEGDVTNSDSFRGERIQDDTPLDVTPETLQEHFEPTVVQKSPLPSSQDHRTSHTVVHMYPPPSSQDHRTSHRVVHMYPPPLSQDHATSHTSMMKIEDVYPASSATPHTPATTCGTKTVQSQATVMTPASGDSGLTLKEAFLQRKRKFVQNSQQRLQQIKANLEEKKAQEVEKQKLTSNFTHSTPLSAKGASRVTSTCSSPQRRGNGEMESGRSVYDSGIVTGSDVTKKRFVTFSSPLLKQENGVGTSSQSTGHSQISDWLSSKQREKIKKKEMRERNERFYQRLPEVRKKMEEDQKKQTNDVNRNKAKHYQERIRSRLKAKKQPTEHEKTPQVSVTSRARTKQPFK